MQLSRLREIIDKVLDEENLDEVDLDPSNNPGRPDDAHDYLGMRPKIGPLTAFTGGGESSSTSTEE